MLRNKFFHLNTILGTLVMIAGVSVASADEQSLHIGEYIKIAGTASFAHHHTLIPLAFCEGTPTCTHPQSYWTLVVQSAQTRYELDQSFALGSDSAPESIQLESVVIRPGSHLTMDARVSVVSRSTAILSDPHNVNVVMDETVAASSPFYGWSCHSVGENHPVYVDVAQVSRNGGYSMRIQAATGDPEHAIQTVANFGEVALNMNEDAIDFAGSSKKLAAELSIDQRGGRLNDLVSVLKMENPLRLTDLEQPLETLVNLSCNRTR